MLLNKSLFHRWEWEYQHIAGTKPNFFLLREVLTLEIDKKQHYEISNTTE